MARSRFSIGIDLGTTNCALAFVPLQGEGTSRILAIGQWESVSTVTEAATLPSYLYLPEQETAAQMQAGLGIEQWVIGRLAEKKAAQTPGRVAHSSKSWLCHHAADRSARFLPWGSDEIDGRQKISPVYASALILGHLKKAWNRRFASAGAEFEFDSQDITITVPASFDAAAQGLTLMAAKEAGFPETVRLLEEPQAAFYCWLEQHDLSAELWNKLPNSWDRTHRILVVDIGGGTSDFSLFELSRSSNGAPTLKREAVSDHILLGGDNIDLAIAHHLEPRLVEERGKLSGPQWEVLVAACRDLKETILSSTDGPDEAFSVALPGRGSGLIAASRTAQLTRAEVWKLLVEGFFPLCDLQARPYRIQAGLTEWGLPYAPDSAITRHLADFMRGRPPVEAILFNGGSLRPELLRKRVCEQVGNWQGSAPLALLNAEPDLAVARGAALFGRSLNQKTNRIEAGNAQAVFLEVEDQRPAAVEGARPRLVCVLPQAASSGQCFRIATLPLEVHANRSVHFRAYSSTRHQQSKAGDLIVWREEDFRALPPLETVIRVADITPGAATNTVPVLLTARVNELGLLRVSCDRIGSKIKQSWPLEFDLRQHQRGSPATLAAAGVDSAEPNAAAEELASSRRRIQTWFGQSAKENHQRNAIRLFRNLEQALGMPRSEWNATLIRSLWSVLESCTPRRSPEHEATWLSLAGFLLRPGFGVAGDTARIDSLWRLCVDRPHFSEKRVKVEEYILWRRVAGGLTRERQEQILACESDKIYARKNPPAEVIQLAGSLERLSIEKKVELVERFIVIVADLALARKHCAPYLVALGLLLRRVPSYAGPEAVLPPELVERAYKSLRGFDWALPELSEMQTLFLRAARVIGDRALDVPKAVRSQIASQLEKSGVALQKTGKLREFAPLSRRERIDQHGESLPPGLILSENL